ncbi:MAG: nitroreductase/quinone reductase family protein [Chloroflexota bacterium]|nr:nitroreductase/quinone reductase family protein [Chloroflexota bacterium]
MSDYRRPNWLVRKIGNPVVQFIIGRLGIPIRGGALLTIPGRSTGSLHSVPMYPLTVDGKRYLVAPRGQTAWVRNLRAAGAGELRLGRERERIVATEVANVDKPPILRAYLDRWHPETGALFGVPKSATLEQLAAISASHPVFHIETTSG